MLFFLYGGLSGPFFGTGRSKKTQKSKFLLTKSTFRLVGLKSVCIQVEKNAVERILKNIASSSRKLDFSIFSLCDSRKTTKSADFGLFSILLVSRLRLTCSVCDGTLETSYWKCRQWVLRVYKLANIQNFIFYGHFGAKNHCCTVYTGISRFSIFEEV